MNLYPISKVAAAVNYQALITRLKARETVLVNDASEWRTEWRDIAQWCYPFRSRMPEERTNKRPKRRSTRTINDTPRRAISFCGSGMMEYITSPSRPWFKSSVADYDATEDHEVAAWLEIVDRRMRDVFTRSNLYTVLPSVYGELVGFGTAAMSIYDDPETVVRFRAHTVGTFYAACDGRDEATTVVLPVQMSVEQLVQRYGEQNVSDQTREMYRQNQLDTMVEVRHWIYRNPRYQKGNPAPRMRAYECVTYEWSCNDRVLEISGHFELPTTVVRWEPLESDAYGTGPGNYMLGDAKAIQVYERQKARLLAKLADPNYVAPASLKNAPDGVHLNEGGITYADVPGRDALRVLHEVNPASLAAISTEIAIHEQRIRQAAFEDLFLMLANSDRPQKTAYEVEKRVEEKLVMLGPVLQRVYGELLNRIYDRTFGAMQRAGMLPPPPAQIAEMPLKVEFTGILAQAQKAIGIGAVDRFVLSVQSVSALKPQALDKFDETQAIDIYRDMLGVSSTLVLPDAEVQAKRAAMAEQQAQQQAMQAAQAAGGVARDVAQATAQPSALQEAMRLVGMA
jgi:hypothetical protein